MSLSKRKCLGKKYTLYHQNYNFVEGAARVLPQSFIRTIKQKKENITYNQSVERSRQAKTMKIKKKTLKIETTTENLKKG